MQGKGSLINLLCLSISDLKEILTRQDRKFKSPRLNETIKTSLSSPSPQPPASLPASLFAPSILAPPLLSANEIDCEKSFPLAKFLF